MPIRMDKGRPGGLARANAAVAKELQLLGATLILGGRDARKDAAIVLTGVVKETLSTPGRGEVVRSRASTEGSFIPHTASLPGDPPAPDLGELRNSIAWQHQGQVTRVGSGLPQAPALEFTMNRPFMRPSLLKARGEMTRAAVRAFKRVGERRAKRGRKGKR